MNKNRYRNGSISMFIDKNKEDKKWINDSAVDNCIMCRTQFNFINRKHHCRYCGKIFCHNCSNYWIKIPDNLKINNIENYYNSNENDRVCKQCFIEIDEYNKFIVLSEFFDLIGLNLVDFGNILFVSKSWNKIARYYINNFRELQYILPNLDYSKNKINILKNNINFFSGHSRWILLLILTQTNYDIVYTNKIISILNSNKTRECDKLCCHNDCSDYLSLSNIILCLDKGIYNIHIINYLIKCMENIDQNELLYYFSIIINSLKLYENHTKCLKVILNLLFKISVNSIEISNNFFWELTYHIDNKNKSTFYKNIRYQLLEKLDIKTNKLFNKVYDFTNYIINISNIDQPNLNEYLYNNLNLNNFRLPININEEYLHINIEKVKIINSKTKPIIIPCVLSKNKTTKEYIIKNEDIYKEYIIMNIIKLFDFYLKKKGLDLNIVTYNILPISSKRGFIEFVDNSYTLYDIREQHLFSIQNFIMEKNPNITAKQLRDNFSKSCAAYCIITYLLGIGDRHLENIMITDKGYIFNIDFGYVIGKDPKIISPEFRITSEMIDAMGGYQSIYYKNFQNYCKIAFNHIRIYTPIFHKYLSLLYKISPTINNPLYTKNDIDKHVNEKFIPSKPYQDIDFKYKILANSNTYSGDIIDFIHKQNKTSSCSFTSPTSNVNSNLYTSTVNVLENTKELGYSLGNGIKSLIWSNTE